MIIKSNTKKWIITYWYHHRNIDWTIALNGKPCERNWGFQHPSSPSLTHCSPFYWNLMSYCILQYLHLHEDKLYSTKLIRLLYSKHCLRLDQYLELNRICHDLELIDPEFFSVTIYRSMLMVERYHEHLETEKPKYYHAKKMFKL